MRLALSLPLAALLAVCCSTPQRLAADLVVTGARIWTGNPLQPDAAAIAMIGERIVDVGSDDEVGRWLGPNTTVIDAGGRRVVPGFNDGDEELKGIAGFLAGVSCDIPWHVTAFHPDYKMTDPPRTPAETLIRAYDFGKAAGLRYVYPGKDQ